MKLRLLKVIVQPVFALDDGDALTEQPGEPVTVSPAEWPTFATDRFAQGFEQLRQQVEGPSEAVTNPTPPCPEHGPVQVHAGGPDGPLVCPLCPNTVPA